MHLPFVTDGLPGPAGKGSLTSVGASLQCRGAAFSCGIDQPPQNTDADSSDIDRYYLYTVQCRKAGPTHLLKWRVVCETKTETKGRKAPPTGAAPLGSSDHRVSATTTEIVTTVKGSVETAVHVCAAPAIRLAVSGSGLFIAVGASDGACYVYSAPSMRKYGRYLCHDLPVTGLVFAPESVAIQHAVPEVLSSCSADNRLAIIPLGGASPWLEKISMVIMTLIVLLLALVTLAVLSGLAVPGISII
jgi:hypothetical protein